jgi:glycosyltransferase involved in cell wall biosynthesis
LVTNGLLYGGAERIVEAIAVDLYQQRYAVRVVATTRDGEIGESLRARGIPVDVLNIKNAFDVRVALELSKIVRHHRAQIVHSHLTVSDLANAAAHPLSFGTAMVSTVHSAYVGLNPIVRRAWHAALFAFHRVIAVSETVRESLPRALKTVIVRPSLIDATPGIDRAAARARLGIADEVPLVLSVGRLVEVKGYDVLAEAAKYLRTANVRVVVIGEGPMRAGLEKTGGLELIGSRADAGELMAAADVVVSPSRSEGFPQAPLHAMAAGVAVVATRAGGTPEVVIDGETGVLVAPENPRALAEGIDRLLSDRALAKRFGLAGKARLVDAGLTKSAMLTRMRTIYRELLLRSSPGM